VPSVNSESGNQTVAAGSPVTMTVDASGGNLSYQWWHDLSQIPGATDPSYTINAAQPSDAGNYFCNISNPCDYVRSDPATLTVTSASCYPNCDQSTTPPILNANDFQCFLNAFAANDPYANCDGSTTDPTLNANDFQCFLNAYAAGCP